MPINARWSLWLALLVLVGPVATRATPVDMARWTAEARRVEIVRDDWGIAHVHGRSDADTVFGAIYAQAEDDFNRIETNYLTSLGRTSLAEGETGLWTDLRARLYVSDEDLRSRFRASPVWLRHLMIAWADGLNFYLATHPKLRPRAIRHFEPWMALSFTEGSIGGDVERILPEDLAKFYGHQTLKVARASPEGPIREPSGSNGIAIAPENTVDHHALLLINPHTSFYFRSELQMTSDEGLDTYGASTWGQFFIYQGFNAHAGWMHTSTAANVVTEYLETIVRRKGRLFYRYGADLRPVTSRRIVIGVRRSTGQIAPRRFTAYFTRHGPIIRQSGDKWVSFAMMYKPVEALSQSFLRTRAKDYADFIRIAALNANSSNNTVFADDRGEIAYLHPQFIPKRDDRIDFAHPVPGEEPATDWKGEHRLEETPHILNPKVGWIFNTNDWPYSAAGPDSPKREDFPRYMDTAGENPRGIHAARVLAGRRDFTREGLAKAAFDPYLPVFARLMPLLIAAYDRLPPDSPDRAGLADQIAALRQWNYTWAADSVATSLSVFWAEALYVANGYDPNGEEQVIYEYKPIYEILADRATPEQMLSALRTASARLTTDFGTWKTPWGEINRFQRLNDNIAQTFRDDQPSLPVPFTSAEWGSLAAYGGHRYPGTRRYYGDFGNTFVAVVEFGPRVRALAVSPGGESGDASSPHFRDQAARYAAGDLREVYFYPDQLAGHVVSRYRPH
jgi:acyl-homoserine-lactone acylase